MKEDKKGFVYILTNESFREDWVKIGKTSRPVDIRSKQLDNTSVPLPFNIYATVESSKYEEIEKMLHKILTELGDKRIRQNREFFNIKPEDAFSYLYDLAELVGDAKINAPDEVQKDHEINSKNRKSTYKGKYHIEGEKFFYIEKDVVDAKMQVINGNKYIVLEGSKIDLKIYNTADYIEASRFKKSDHLSSNIVIKNIEFSSPSSAASFVRGGSTNGKIYWRSSDNKPLADFIVYDN